jgi:5-amino-6-(5-phosphoribosylamino)uracil reductase
MADGVYVLLSCAMSVDGAIDDTSDGRLMLSDAADWDRVDELRASCDALLVGAGTIRADDPRLVVRSEARRAARRARGVFEDPTKVTLTRRGDVDPRAAFFVAGDAPKLVYCPAAGDEPTRRRLGRVATVVALGRGGSHDDDTAAPVDLRLVLDDLAARDVRRLMVEGGSATHTAFLTGGLVDELRLAIAPFFVGQPNAPRLVNAGEFPHDTRNRMRLDDVEAIGDLLVVRYLLRRSDSI